ncbi:hypothetical protein KQ805_03055 [Listeria monocytogenes]|uniref:Phage protein n=1 Tax=Listeria monocytogenes TaxID=1639 RepID=A0AAN2ZXA0_LISMN|nr:hypothetical protein [Listeria monocytogenes]EAD6244918.1 hypothetical protein [Listeria monocytogenes]EAE2103905.1 hypothetical protein [Listeria monocytogenes]EAE2639903.1 hypothetical protein [Listeria monocytogenes]EAE2658408.1 hypothetical protein [Listeria monocytogenes]EAE2723138.1 hypothetical protein [Listeria monocytogenes]
MKYRKKPVVIEAFCFGYEPSPDWFSAVITADETGSLFADIKTLEGTMRAERGDYVIKGVQGEIYPCKPDIFEQTYEKA